MSAVKEQLLAKLGFPVRGQWPAQCPDDDAGNSEAEFKIWLSEVEQLLTVKLKSGPVAL